jgi:hypothetical protein
VSCSGVRARPRAGAAAAARGALGQEPAGTPGAQREQRERGVVVEIVIDCDCDWDRD